MLKLLIRPCSYLHRSNGLPEAVTNLLQASAMSGNGTAGVRAPGLSRPPMLIPISSMNPYEVGLQQWAAETIAGGLTDSPKVNVGEISN